MNVLPRKLKSGLIGVLLATACVSASSMARQTALVEDHPSLTITLRPETADARTVTGITVEQHILLPGPSRRLTLSAPLRFAGLVPVGSAISELEVTDAHGRVDITTSDVAPPGGSLVRHWTSTHDVNGDVLVRYQLPLAPFAQSGPPFGVKAAGHGIAGNSGSLLVLPDLPDLRRSTLRWDVSKMASGSQGVIAGGSDAVTVGGPPEALLDRWLMAGPLAAGQQRHGAGFNAYTLGSPPFDKIEMMAWSRRVYASLSKAFGYLGEPDYLLLVRALDAPSYATGTASVASASSLITVGSPTYLPGQGEEKVKGTIAHEMTHNWVGYFGDQAAPWFSEGLTVYVSATLPCETALRPWTDCAAEINRWAKAYYGSKAAVWPNDLIEESPFSQEDVRRVPYGRGMMYFANLDAEIRSCSKGRRTLLTALRPLFEERREGKPITVKRWEAWLKHEQGLRGVSVFRQTVLEGQLIRPRPDVFGRRLRVTRTSGKERGGTAIEYAWDAKR